MIYFIIFGWGFPKQRTNVIRSRFRTELIRYTGWIFDLYIYFKFRFLRSKIESSWCLFNFRLYSFIWLYSYYYFHIISLGIFVNKSQNDSMSQSMSYIENLNMIEYFQIASRYKFNFYRQIGTHIRKLMKY